MAQLFAQKIEANFTVESNALAIRPTTSPEGLAFAYGSLILMALFPIIIGAFRSLNVSHFTKQKESGETIFSSLLSEQQEVKVVKFGSLRPRAPRLLMNEKFAALYPFIASTALLSLYLYQAYPNYFPNFLIILIKIYYFCLWIRALIKLLTPIANRFIPDSVPKFCFNLPFFNLSKSLQIDLYEYSSHDLICLTVCNGIFLWYYLQKHWIANNLFAIAFAVLSIEQNIHLKNAMTGCVLLGGFFFYDIFWVFGTDVTVTVAKYYDAPLKLFFPVDFLQNGFRANKFIMLGLGDIIFPGIFIALLLRFDQSLKRGRNIYFNTNIAAYILGLVCTFCMGQLYRHAQPALLYVVPVCLGTPLILALVRGDIKKMFRYEESTAESVAGKEEEEEKKDQ